VAGAEVFEHEFLITADENGHNIYQLGLRAGERRIVGLLARDSQPQPVAVAFDELRRVVYWTDNATASVVSCPLTTPNGPATTVVYAAGRNLRAVNSVIKTRAQSIAISVSV